MKMSKSLRDKLKEISLMSDEPNLSTPGNIALETINADLEENGNFAGVDNMELNSETDELTLSLLSDIEPDDWALELEADAMMHFEEEIQVSIKAVKNNFDGTVTYRLTIK